MSCAREGTTAENDPFWHFVCSLSKAVTSNAARGGWWVEWNSVAEHDFEWNSEKPLNYSLVSVCMPWPPGRPLCKDWQQGWHNSPSWSLIQPDPSLQMKPSCHAKHLLLSLAYLLGKCTTHWHVENQLCSSVNTQMDVDFELNGLKQMLQMKIITQPNRTKQQLEFHQERE